MNFLFRFGDKGRDRVKIPRIPMTTAVHANICVVLPAAGAAARFGSAKQIVDIDGVAMVRRCALNAIGTGARGVVVTGAWRDDVESALRDLDLTVLHNANWEKGLGTSIACAIEVVAIDPDIEAVIVLLADQPLVSGDDLRELISQHRLQPDRIVAASANGTITPPCLFPRAYFAELRRLHDDRGARTLIDRHCDRLVVVPMANAAVDIDTPDAHARLAHTFLTRDPLR